MLNGNYISVSNIIEKVYRDSGIDNVDWQEAVEWAGDCISLLAVPSQYSEVISDPLEIEDYKVKLPDGLINLKACRRVVIRDGSIGVLGMMVQTSALFFKSQDTSDVVSDSLLIPSFPSVELDEDGNSSNIIVEVPLTQYNAESNNYKVDSGYIYTDFKSGYIQLVYDTFPTDNMGLPMIPDNEKYRKAVSLFILERLDYRKFRSNPISSNQVIWNDTKQELAFYMGAARNKARLPNVDGMESIKNWWLRSIPKTTKFDDGFKTLNKPEQRYNNNL